MTIEVDQLWYPNNAHARYPDGTPNRLFKIDEIIEVDGEEHVIVDLIDRAEDGTQTQIYAYALNMETGEDEITDQEVHSQLPVCLFHFCELDEDGISICAEASHDRMVLQWLS